LQSALQCSIPKSEKGPFWFDSEYFHSLTVQEEIMSEPKDGYVRCGVIHLGAHLKFDVVNETPQVTVLTVVVDEGPLHIALSRTAAESLQQKLELFMKDWPEGTY
jgi:hypothetical protein